MPNNKATLAHYSKWILIAVIGLGFFLRSYKLYEIMRWDDSARDVLIAKHYVNKKRIEFIVPATAGRGIVKNSPFYYLTITFFWFIVRSPYLVAVIFSLLGSLTILINFYIGSLIKNEKLGLIIAALTALSPSSIEYSRSIFQPHLIPTYTSLAVLFLLLTYREKKWVWMCCSMFVFFLGLHTHYSIMVLLPTFSGLWGWIAYKIFSKEKDLSWLVLSFLFYLSLLFLFFITTNHGKGNIDIFVYLSKVNLLNLVLLSEILILISKWFLFSEFNMISIIFYGILLLCLGGKNYSKRHDISILMILLLWCSLFLSLINVDVMIVSYFAPFMPLTLILVGYAILYSTEKKKYLFFLLLSLFIFPNLLFQYQQVKYRIKDFEVSEKISQIIYSDYTKGSKVNNYDFLPKFIVSEKCKDCYTYNWFSPKYWYFLEEKVNQDLIEISPSFNNIQPLQKNPVVIYLVCRDYSEELVTAQCLEEYVTHYHKPLRIADESMYEDHKLGIFLFRLVVNDKN